MKRLLSLTLALIMVAVALPGVTQGVAADEPLTPQYGSNNKFLAPIDDDIPDDTVKISNETDLKEIPTGTASAGKYYYLTDNIDLSGAKWTPISDFRGTFDGQGHVISGLTITGETTTQYAGLFSYVKTTLTNSVTIKNVGLEGTNIEITSTSNTLYAGALIADATQPTNCGAINISNCYNIGTVAVNGSVGSPMIYAGGLIGCVLNETLELAISDCYNKSDVTAESSAGIVRAGGIFGGSAINNTSRGGLNLVNCFNDGEISAKNSFNANADAYAGGIFASYSNNISGSTSSNYTATVRNCRNSGDVVATGYAAHASGLIGHIGSGITSGYLKQFTVSQCENTGAVTATGASYNTYAGGLIGRTANGSNSMTITESRSTGNVEAVSTVTSAYAGGLIGYTSDSLTMIDCYSTGNITATAPTHYAGGLIGNSTKDPTPTNCYAIGDLSDVEMKQKESFTGWDFTDTWDIDENYDYPYLRAFEHPNAIRVTVKFYKDNLNGTPDIISFRFTDKKAGDRITPADIRDKLGDDWLNDGNTDEGKYGVALVSYPTLTGERGKDVVKVLYMQR